MAGEVLLGHIVNWSFITFMMQGLLLVAIEVQYL